MGREKISDFDLVREREREREIEGEKEGFLGFDLEKKNRTDVSLVSFTLGLFLKIKWGEMLSRVKYWVGGK